MSSYRGTPSPKYNADGTPDYEIKSRPALTFGFELEFGIACLPRGYQDPDPEDCRQIYGIMEKDQPDSALTVADKGLHEPDDMLYDFDHITLVQQHVAETLRGQGLLAFSESDAFASDEDMHAGWLVKGDDSVKFPPLNYIFRDIEINSPPFFYCKEALHEVEVVCETLPSKYRLITNTSCSIHVHVGNRDLGFTLEHLQNLMALLWAFEPQLETLHPHHRVGSSRYNRSLRKDSNLAMHLVDTNKTAKDGLQQIFDAEYTEEIVKMFMPPWVGGMACNVSNLSDYADDMKKTIEFRNHEGTFDSEAATQWVRLCVHLVEFAEEVKTSRLRAWLEEHMDTDYNIIQILEATKQPLAAWYYEKKLAERAALGSDTSERIEERWVIEHLAEDMITDRIRDNAAWRKGITD